MTCCGPVPPPRPRAQAAEAAAAHALPGRQRPNSLELDELGAGPSWRPANKSAEERADGRTDGARVLAPCDMLASGRRAEGKFKFAPRGARAAGAATRGPEHKIKAPSARGRGPKKSRRERRAKSRRAPIVCGAPMGPHRPNSERVRELGGRRAFRFSPAPRSNRVLDRNLQLFVAHQFLAAPARNFAGFSAASSAAGQPASQPIRSISFGGGGWKVLAQVGRQPGGRKCVPAWRKQAPSAASVRRRRRRRRPAGRQASAAKVNGP